MHDLLQPYLNDIITTLIGLLVSSVLYLVARFRMKMDTFIASHTNAQQRAILGVIANEAVAYAGSVYKEQNGEQRLQGAIDYVNKHLPLGLSFSEAELRGAIEKAYADYQAKVQTPTVTNATVSVQGQTDAKQASDAVVKLLKGKADAGAIGALPSDLQNAPK